MEKETTIENLEAQKKQLLAKYKALQEPLEYAQNDFELEIIKQQREALATQIKDLASQINQQTKNG